LRTEEIVNQSDDDDAVHEQAVPVASVTVTLTLPPAIAAVKLDGLIEKLQDAPACVTMNGRSAIVIVPLRGPPVLLAALNATVPLPVPDGPPVIEIHEALALADHVHPLPAVTVTEPLPPPTSIDASDAERL